MTAREIRRKYLEFFESKGHSIYPSGSLVPIDVTGRLDESLLFNGAGMVQFKPFFRGAAEPPNKRLTTAQKCVRTGDIEEVGNLSHLTFFEMLGNFSFGDYFKLEAIDYSWEFLTSTQWLGLDPNRLSFTVFEDDDEAYAQWSKHFASVGIDAQYRVFRLGEETNYWPAGAFSNGPPGPCGPNSEMFYWTSDAPPPGDGYTAADWLKDDDAKNWLEIWNDVFIQFEWQGTLRDPARPSAGYEKTAMPGLPFRSIDTGMGLDRTAAVLGGFKSVYETDLFRPILDVIDRIYKTYPTYKPYGSDDVSDRAIRVIADHIRTACFCIADGILPSNTGRGYVLRRLIRRAVLKGARVLGFEAPFFHLVFDGVHAAMGDHYTELGERAEMILETLLNEEAQFRRTLKDGQGYFEKGIVEVQSDLAAMTSTYVSQALPHDQVVGWGFGATYSSENGTELYADGLGKIKLSATSDSIAYVKARIGAQRALNPQLVFDFISKSDLRKSHWDVATAFVERSLVPGTLAFKLYDTYGFPLEVTRELCQELGVDVDVDGYEAALKEAQERSRGASAMESVYGGVSDGLGQVAPSTPTEFVGYIIDELQSRIVGALPEIGEDGLSTGYIAFALDRSPFYAESGGQVGDAGTVSCDMFNLTVQNVIKQNGIWIHEAFSEAYKGREKEDIERQFVAEMFNQTVVASIDRPRRNRIERNHTSTHILHAALRTVLGKHVTQAGSLVSPDHLRFDFTHGAAMTPSEIAEVEQLANDWALSGAPVTIYNDLPIAEAKAMGAMALFGEKYGNLVRMVEIGDFSRELCGGTHTGTSAEVGLFKVVHESSAASGVRRIEAVSGESAIEWLNGQLAVLREASHLLKTSPRDLTQSIEKTLEQLKDERKKREKLAQQGAGAPSAAIESVGRVELAVQRLEDVTPKDAQAVADRLVEGQPNRVALIALVAEGKVTFVCKAGPDAVANGAHAGNMVKEAARLTGGGGGGRPDFATAGGRDLSQIDAALDGAKAVLG